MNIVAVLYEASVAKCDIKQLQQANTQYILIASPYSMTQFDKAHLAFFNRLHEVPMVTDASVIDILDGYINAADTESVRVITSNESCMLVAALVNEHFDLPGLRPSEILPFANKVIMKQRLANSTIRYPKFIAHDKAAFQQDATAYVQHVTDSLSFPLIAKPIDEHGSIGVSQLNDVTALRSWLSATLDDNFSYEIDEYINGVLYHCDSLIKDGKVQYFSVSEYTMPCMQFEKGYPFGSLDLSTDDPRWQALYDFNQTALRELKAPNGATHLEVFETPAGELIFLEVGARPPGAMITPIHEKNTGLNFELAHFQLQLGNDIDFSEKEQQDEQQYAWCYLPKRQGKNTRDDLPNLNSDVKIKWNIPKAGLVTRASRNISSDNEVAAYMTLVHADYAMLKADMQTLRSYNVS